MSWVRTPSPAPMIFNLLLYFDNIMQTKIEELGTCKKKISIEVSCEEIKTELDKEFEKVKENAAVPGFRKGRVPRSMLQKRFGKHLEDEVKQNVVNNSYQEALEENKLVPLGMPEFGEIDFALDKPLNFDITLEVKPDFEIKDYKGLEVQKKSAKVTDKMVDDELKRLSLSKSTLSTVKTGTIRKEDLVICDLNVEVDGKIVYQDDNIDVLVSGNLIEGIEVPSMEASLLGLKAGNETVIKATLPENYKVAEFSKKEAELKINISEIKRQKASKIDDEFAKSLHFDSLEDLKDKLELELENQEKMVSQADVYKQVNDKLLSLVDFDLPEGFVNSMTEERAERYRSDMIKKGEPLNEVQGVEQEVKEKSASEVIRESKLSFIHEYIANEEKIYVTDDELEKTIANYARNYNLTMEKMYNYLEKVGSLRSMRVQLREDKTMDFLVKEANIIEGSK